MSTVKVDNIEDLSGVGNITLKAGSTIIFKDSADNDICYITNNGLNIISSAWNGAHLVFGGMHFWVDASNNYRAHSSAPTSDTDGVVIANIP